MRRQSEEHGGVEPTGQLIDEVPAPPQVVVEVCRCGCTPEPEEADWPLAQAWAWLTTLPETDEDDEPDPESLPWWDARSSQNRRRAVLPLVLLGELQAGVLVRALWEVAQSGSGPTA